MTKLPLSLQVLTLSFALLAAPLSIAADAGKAAGAETQISADQAAQPMTKAEFKAKQKVEKEKFKADQKAAKEECKAKKKAAKEAFKAKQKAEKEEFKTKLKANKMK